MQLISKCNIDNYGSMNKYYNYQPYPLYVQYYPCIVNYTPFCPPYPTFGCSGRRSTFEEMKSQIETGWDHVLWSESYGIGDAAALAACIYFGCALAYLGNRLFDLERKVGRDLIEDALEDKGRIYSIEDTEIEAGLAYWSVCVKIWNPIKRRCECVTTERYVRLYIRWRRKDTE